MKKAKKLSNKLMAALLSMAMILTTVLPSTTVYAAEPAIEEETVESEDTSSDNEVPDGIGTENGTTDESGSGEEGSGETTPGDEGTDENIPGDEETDEPGSGEEGSGETTPGDEETDEPGSGENGSDENDVDVEGSDENVEGEETEFDAEVDELLAEDALKDEAVAPANVTKFTAGGWNESIYAEIEGAKDANITAVKWSGTASGELTGEDFDYLVRDAGSNKVRIDILGLAPGTYNLTVSVDDDSSKELKKENIEVYAYDRAGYAHFDSAAGNHGTGVGAYKDDGTLKPNAKIIYVTDSNKNSVELSVTVNGVTTTVKGIGNILNSVGQDTGGGTTDKGSTITNTNQGIIRKLADAGQPLVVRFIGTVSESRLYQIGKYDAADAGAIEGLTDYDDLGNGGSVGDNGHMARMKSGKDITLEGIGYDATIDGWGFHFMAETSSADKGYGQSFEVRNLTFINTPEDAIGMEGVQPSEKITSDLSAPVERCWIHHNEFYSPNIGSPAESDKSEGDGSVDFKRGQWFTCSYNYFEGCHKTNLVGSSKTSLQYNLSYHHNYWYLCKGRGPLARNSNIHMYNNVFDMQTDYAMGPRAGAYIFSEYNMFYASKQPQHVEPGKETTEEWQINAIKSYNDNLASPQLKFPATVVENKTDYVENGCRFTARKIDYSRFDTEGNYSYIPADSVDQKGYENYVASLKTDFTELRKVIASQTGVMDQTPVLPEDVSPSYYSVVDRNINQNKSSITNIDLATGYTYENTKSTKSKVPFAFYINGSADLEVSYSGSIAGTLVNEAGENLLEGDGYYLELPEGKYMIQPNDIQAGSYSEGKATLATFKELIISSLKITAHDPNAHHHKWVLNENDSIPATCTDAGTNYYDCTADGECDQNNRKEEAAAPLGHSYGAWVVVREATDTEPGERRRDCTRAGCTSDTTGHTEIQPIPVGQGSGGGSTGGGSTVEGDYILYFEDGQEVDPSNYFTVAGSIQKNQDNITIGDKTYTDSLKMDGSGKVTFSCNEGASLTMIFKSDNSGKRIDITGANSGTKMTETIAKDSDGRLSIAVKDLPADTYSITKNNGESKLFYVAVTNPASNVSYVNLLLEYNYDDSPDAKEVEVPEGTVFATAQNLASYAGFSRRNYTLKGFYTDSDCINAVTFPYTAGSDATLYADWEANAEEEISYYITFNTDGGTAVPQIRVSTKEVHVLTETTTKPGFAFAGWYDADPKDTNSGAKRIDKIIGSELTGPKTVYAKWNPLGEASSDLSLVVAEDLKYLGDISSSTGVKITGDTPVQGKGFTIHAGDGKEVSIGDNKTRKYFMTVKSNLLYTNDVYFPDDEGDNKLLKSIEFTTDGPGTLEVVVNNSGGTYNQCDLTLGQLSGTSLEAISDVTIGASKVTVDFEIEEAGKYYLYVVGDKGVAYTSIKFLKPVYTIVYQTGMGTAKTELPDAETKKPGDMINLPECEPMPGYIFKGWSSKTGAIAKTGETYTYTVSASDEVNGTITLTAVYDVDPNYKPGGSGGGDEGDPDQESGLAIVGLEETYEYTGAKIIPNIGVIDYSVGENGTLLAPGIDYTVKYSNNVMSSTDPKNKAKSATVTVTGKGNYAGKDQNAKFTIVENSELTEGLLDLNGAKIDKIDQVNYNGKPQYPNIKLTLKKQSAVTYTYDEGLGYYVKSGATEGTPERLQANVTLSNNINKGTATILITGAKGSNGKATTVKKTFKISALDISSKATITSTPGKYAVKGATPGSLDVKITLDGEEVTLRKGIDYTVKYSSNKNGGAKGSIAITGKGNYAKKKTAPFDVEKLNLEDCEITGVVAYADLKTNKIKATVLDGQKNALKASQYTLKVYKDSACTEAYTDAKLKAEDVIYVQAEAKDTNNLTDKTAAIPVTVGKNIAKAKVTIVKVNKKTKTFAYTGSAIELNANDLEVMIKEGKNTTKLSMDEGEGGSYEIVGYMNNINKGTATAIIQGTGDYSGTKTVKFKIVGKTMSIDKDKHPTWDSVTNAFKNFMDGLFN